MLKNRSKEENTRYARQRAASNKYNLLRARAAAGLDLSSGWKVSEVITLAKYDLEARQADYQAVINAEQATDEYEELKLKLTVALRGDDLTEEYRAAIVHLYHRIENDAVELRDALPHSQVATPSSQIPVNAAATAGEGSV